MSVPPRLSNQQKFILAIVGTKDAMAMVELDRRWKDETGEKHLSESDRASMARSLRRLSDRGLILRYPVSKTDSDQQVGLPSQMIPEGVSTRWIIPTTDGREVSQELERRIKDSRYNLSFSTELP